MSAKLIDFKGFEAVQLRSGRYAAVIAPSLGSNVMRFQDEENNIDVFRYSEEQTAAQFMNSTEVWGLPTLYLPNRFDHGVLKTSDFVYYLPVNETKFKNHIHGFLQKRAHRIADMSGSSVTTEYIYDERDFFYSVFPIKFKANITVSLSNEGLTHSVKLTNLSEDRVLPVSIATHTTYNAPFVKGGRQENIRLIVPAKEKLPFDKKRWLPTGKTETLTDYDRGYLTGKCPVLTDICNDMYSAGKTELDGKQFNGAVMTDIKSGKRICNEILENYNYWIVWNDKGFENYFCVEPMTAQVNAPNLMLPPDQTGYRELKAGEEYIASQRFFTE